MQSAQLSQVHECCPNYCGARAGKANTFHIKYIRLRVSGHCCVLVTIPASYFCNSGVQSPPESRPSSQRFTNSSRQMLV